jgi:ABC-type multidrug transport system fused ATPase/permease subunit
MSSAEQQGPSRRSRRRRHDRPGEAADDKSKTYAAFWRAFRFLLPYRGMVTVSILCALFVGVAFAGGLGTMLPIMRVLIEGDTIKSWVDREIVESRLDVHLADQPATDLGGAHIASTDRKGRGAAAAAGLRAGDRIDATAGTGAVSATLDRLADPDAASAQVRTGDGRAVTLALPAVPWYLKVGRGVAVRMPTDPVWAIAAVFGIICTLAVTSNVVKFFQEYFSDKAAISAVNDIRRGLYDHVLHVPLAHYGSRGTSDITSRLVQDSQQMEVGFKAVLGQTIQEPIKAGAAFALGLFASWKLTLFMIVFVPLMAVVIKKFGKKMRRASRAALQNSATMLGQIEGTLTGIRVVKGAGAERFERRRYSRIMSRLVGEQLRMSRIDAFTQPTLETLSLFAFGAVLLVASHMMFRATEPLDKEQFFLVIACLVAIADSLRRVSKVNNVLQRANAAAVRVFEVMDLPAERRRGLAGRQVVPALAASDGAGNGSALPYQPTAGLKLDGINVVNLPPIQREIRFEHVTFAYPNAPAPAVSDVSLVIPKGRCVAVVGRNGSGKTTLLALLPRFYDPQAGRVTIDGVDLRTVSLRSLRRQISVVTQDSVIFPGTIAENIAYGHPLAARLAEPAAGDGAAVRAVRERVAAAAKRAFAHDFILEKPRGYDTVLGEMGGQLSGGQKQRLCIARAIFRHAPILILDEATSQVDAESEHLIQQAIDSLLHEGHDSATGAPTSAAPTLFVIAHRFSTILSADSIVVMDRGRVVGQGRHDELLGSCETYQQLYERQLFAPPTPIQSSSTIIDDPSTPAPVAKAPVPTT